MGQRAPARHSDPGEEYTMAERESRSVAARAETRPAERPSQRDNPFSFVRRFAEQMDRLFDDFGFGFGGALSPRIQLGPPSGEGRWAPDVDVFEREGNLVVRADLPGMKREDIEVEIRDNMICVSGERRHEEEKREGGFYRMERGYGSFCRTIPLMEGADVDKAQASFRDGVLEVTVPVPQARRGRRIEIKEGTAQGQPKRAAS
jgi:HSP20 family protein